MGVLKAAARKRSATVVVKGKAKFPIPDKAHAKAALGRINQAKPPLTPAQKAKVRAKAHRVLGNPMDESRAHEMRRGDMREDRGEKGR